MPESPRWLEARERHDQARKIMERMEARAIRGGRIVLPEPDLNPYEVVAEEKTNMFAPFGKKFVVVTVFLLVVMALGYGGIVYGGASQAFLFLALNRGFTAGGVFALVSWAGVAASIVYLINAFFGERFERKYTQLVGALLYAGGWWGVYAVHSTVWVDTFYIISTIGTILWLWSMYVYIPINYPTRMRSLGTGWTDGVGHLGAWGGVLIAGQLYLATAPRSFIIFITIPCALVPGLLVAIFGKRQRSRASRSWPSRAGLPDAGPPALGSRPLALSRGVCGGPGRCHRRPGPHRSRPPATSVMAGGLLRELAAAHRPATTRCASCPRTPACSRPGSRAPGPGPASGRQIPVVASDIPARAGLLARRRHPLAGASRAALPSVRGLEELEPQTGPPGAVRPEGSADALAPPGRFQVGEIHEAQGYARSSTHGDCFVTITFQGQSPHRPPGPQPAPPAGATARTARRGPEPTPGVSGVSGPIRKPSLAILGLQG